MKMKVLLLEVMDSAILELMTSCLPKEFELIAVKTKDEEERMAKVVDADFIMVAPTAVNRQLIEKGKKLKLIQKLGAGLNNIDLEAATIKGVPVANAGGTNAIAVAEHTITLILALYKKLFTVNASLLQGKWSKWDFRSETYEIYRKTVGIIGLGNIGREVAQRLRCFEADILYYDITRLSPETEAELGYRFVAFDELLRTADIVTLHSNLTDETYHMIGENELNIMKESAIIINAARGALIHEQALYKALKEKRIAAAGLDAFEKEPPDPDNPLLYLDNVLVTPHTGGGGFDTLKRIYELAFENMQRVLRGEEPLYQYKGA